MSKYNIGVPKKDACPDGVENASKGSLRLCGEKGVDVVVKKEICENLWKSADKKTAILCDLWLPRRSHRDSGAKAGGLDDLMT